MAKKRYVLIIYKVSNRLKSKSIRVIGLLEVYHLFNVFVLLCAIQIQIQTLFRNHSIASLIVTLVCCLSLIMFHSAQISLAISGPRSANTYHAFNTAYNERTGQNYITNNDQTIRNQTVSSNGNEKATPAIPVSHNEPSQLLVRKTPVSANSNTRPETVLVGINTGDPRDILEIL
jgi:hypothetical protein